MMFGGCVMAFMEYGTGGGILAVARGARARRPRAFHRVPDSAENRRSANARSSPSEITGVSAAFGKEARELIGKSAEALTMLSPSGYVRVDGRRYEAFCQSGQVPAGAALEVIGADNFRLIVSLQTKPTNHTP